VRLSSDGNPINHRKLLFGLLTLTITFSLWSQDIVDVSCDNVGEVAWPFYLEYRKGLAEGKKFASTRTKDENIYPLMLKSTNANHVFKQVYLRWLLTDPSVPYIIRITDIQDRELIRKDLGSCAVKLYPDSIMTRFQTKFLIVHIERKERKGFDEGLIYIIKPQDSQSRIELFKKLEDCEDLNCQLDLLLELGNHYDALSLIEALNEVNHPDKDALTRKYWDIVTMINPQ